MMLRQSLYNRLLMLGIFPALSMCIILVSYMSYVRINDAHDELNRTGQLIADNLAPALEYPVIAGNRKMLEQILKSAMQHRDVAWILVSDAMGETSGLVGSRTSQPDPDINIFTADIIQVPLSMDEQSEPLDWFEIDYLVGSGTLKVGVIEVGLTSAMISTRQWNLLWSVATLSAVLLLITWFFVSRLANQWGRPINVCLQRMTALEKGDFQLTRRPVGTDIDVLYDLDLAVINLAETLQSTQESRDQIISQVESARLRAEQASQAKSEFLAMMSHELRTPLNGVMGMLQLLNDEPLTQQQKEKINTAMQSTDDLILLIGDILDASRIEQGKLAIDHRSFNLSQLIENCSASFSHMAEVKKLSFHVQWVGPWQRDVDVLGDPLRIRQVLANLLENAIAFTPEGSVTLAVTWSQPESGQVFLGCEVKDTGVGIPAQQIGEMFQLFEQLDRSSSRRHGGIGLGLSLAQRLIELMGGHITVDSNIACGSAFRFLIPLELSSNPPKLTFDPAEESATETTSHSSPTNQQPVALVVEDNLVNQRVAIALLQHLDFQVHCAENGLLAFEMITTSDIPFSVVLMDCQMPVMDGWEATRKIRDWEKCNNHKAVPIIAMTADALAGTEQRCLASGMNDYLAKPVRKAFLRDKLSRWLVA